MSIDITTKHGKPTTYEFNIQVQGIEADTMSAFLLVKDLDIGGNLSIPCTLVNKRWSVVIPDLSKLTDKNKHDVELLVFIDDYYFTPSKGALTIVQQPVVKQSKKDVIVTAESVDTPDVDLAENEMLGDSDIVDAQPTQEIEVSESAPATPSLPFKVSSTMIELAKQSKGTLFDRINGKTHVKGIRDPASVANAAEKNAQVLEILKTFKS